jgi:YVTN family beta-propeller protein
VGYPTLAVERLAHGADAGIAEAAFCGCIPVITYGNLKSLIGRGQANFPKVLDFCNCWLCGDSPRNIAFCDKIALLIHRVTGRASSTPRAAVREDAMNVRISGLLALAGFVLAGLLGSAPGHAQNAYITNSGSNNVSVIDTATNSVIGSPITVGTFPKGVEVTPDGSKVYVGNQNSDNVSVINTATDMVIVTIPLGATPNGVAVTPDGSKVYVSVGSPSNAVLVISTATNMVIGSPISVGGDPYGVAVTPDGSKVYVANDGDGTVSVIATATNTVIGSPIAVGTGPTGVAVTPDGYARANTAAVQIFDNSVGNNATALSNTGPLDVVGNKVGNILQCVGNTMLIMGGGNTAPIKQGQCS